MRIFTRFYDSSTQRKQIDDENLNVLCLRFRALVLYRKFSRFCNAASIQLIYYVMFYRLNPKCKTHRISKLTKIPRFETDMLSLQQRLNNAFSKYRNRRNLAKLRSTIVIYREIAGSYLAQIFTMFWCLTSVSVRRQSSRSRFMSVNAPVNVPQTFMNNWWDRTRLPVHCLIFSRSIARTYALPHSVLDGGGVPGIINRLFWIYGEIRLQVMV